MLDQCIGLHHAFVLNASVEKEGQALLPSEHLQQNVNDGVEILVAANASVKFELLPQARTVNHKHTNVKNLLPSFRL